MIIYTIIVASILFTAGIPHERPKVVIEGRSIILYDNNKYYNNDDTEHCYNAVASDKVIRSMRNVIRKGRNSIIHTKIIKNFFANDPTDSNTTWHYTYAGKPVREICSRRDLIVVNSAK